MEPLSLDPKKTAVVLIDLQHGIAGRQTQPHSAPDVIAAGNRLATAFRKKGGTIVYVRVKFDDFMRHPTDEAVQIPDNPPAILSEIVPEAGFTDGDLLITKRHWGAFAGTTLESDLKSRGIETVVLGGIATNLGVESTARQGTGLGFAFVIAEDACSTFSTEMHRFAFDNIFPRLAKVRTTDAILAAIG
jgi:nicotinamidase-related amidase